MKETLFDIIHSQIEEKLNKLLSSAQAHQEALTSDSKSSAGDKHETSRAMVHLEQEKLGKQISLLKQHLGLLNSIRINSKTCEKVETGALVVTNQGKFIISVSHGKIELNNEVYFAVSPSSPIIQKILGLKENDTVMFNGKALVIKSIC